MFYHINGVVTDIEPNLVVLECGGVGYALNASLNTISNVKTGERVKLSEQLSKLQDQAEELRVYEEKIHHLADQMIRIDLDDGVKHNYAIFQDVLAKIK